MFTFAFDHTVAPGVRVYYVNTDRLELCCDLCYTYRAKSVGKVGLTTIEHRFYFDAGLYMEPKYYSHKSTNLLEILFYIKLHAEYGYANTIFNAIEIYV